MQHIIKRTLGGALLASLGLITVGCGDTQDPLESFDDNDQAQSEAVIATSSSVSESFKELSEDELRTTLDSLTVEDLNREQFTERMGSYDRDEYPHWEMASTDYGWSEEIVNENCNVRWMTLFRDAHDVAWDDFDTCTLNAESYWVDEFGYIDPDTGEMRDYLESDDPSEYDIDHLVSLGDAHRTGMYDSTAELREQLANDPDNLAVSDASANRSKGDSSPEDYLPPGEFRCTYTQQYIVVKDRYDLSISTGDLERLEESIEECAA